MNPGFPGLAIPSGRLSGRHWLPGPGVSSHPTDGSALLAAVAAALIDGGFFAEKVAAPSSGPSPPAPHTSTRLQRGLLSFSPLPYSPLASGSDPKSESGHVQRPNDSVVLRRSLQNTSSQRALNTEREECRVVRLRHMPALQASRCLRMPLYDLAPAQRRRRGSDALLLPIVPFWPSSLLLTRCASHRRQVSFAISVVLVVRLLLRSFLLRVR